MSCIARGWPASLALLGSLTAGSAGAGVTVTYGIGSAVESIDRRATFAFVPRATGIRRYTEDGLLFDSRYIDPASRDTAGSYDAEGSEWTTISTTDGQKLVAIEFKARSGSAFADVADRFYWEAHDAGAVVGSGIVTPGYFDFIGFFDPTGFDDLRFKGGNVELLAQIGFAGTRPLYTYFSSYSHYSIDDVRAEVATDSDGDDRFGRFDDCPTVPNPDQADSDLDGEGDVCDAFPQGGSELTESLAQCLDDLAVLAGDPRLADSDADGEDDASDRCPGTAAAAEVDEAGCSLFQFCGAIDARSWQGRLDCDLADWRNDEPRQWKGDCRAVRGSCTAR